MAYFYLEEILRRSIDLFKALLAGIWNGLHGWNDRGEGRGAQTGGVRVAVVDSCRNAVMGLFVTLDCRVVLLEMRCVPCGEKR
jgi:hypothetical protein